METLKNRHEQVQTEHSDTFDWEFAEAQFENSADFGRRPEDETYGRSLSTIYNLGKVAQILPESVTASPEADQVRVEFYTSVEEGFGTDVELGQGLEVRDFDTRPVIGGKVMSKDLKKAVSDMTLAGLICAEKRAEWDAEFAPQLTRTQWDHRNALLVDKMVRGETNYNTRIVISPFPEEAAEKSGNEYWGGIGYVPHLKRGFLQVYHATDQGLVSGSLSFDGSNKEKLKEMFARYDVQIPDGEVTDNWLKYAVTDNLSTDDAKSLAIEIANEAGDPKYKKNANTVDITSEHRQVMDKVFDESYIPACESLALGHQTPEARKLIKQLDKNSESFNDHYKKSLKRMVDNKNVFNDEDMAAIHELLVYSTIEMMRAIYIGNGEKNNNGKDPVLLVRGGIEFSNIQALDTQSFQHILGGFGADGAKSNRAVFACGLSISLGEGNPLDAIMNSNLQKSFGGADSESTTNSKMRCVNCPSCDKFHDEVKEENGKPVCDNPDCKLAGSHAKKENKSISSIISKMFS